jgi:hypothetical protein
VGELNGIVYIKSGFSVNDHTKRVLSGALSHQISMAGAHRVLHVMVAPESGDRPVITMAHELQHAIEVLEAPDVATEAAVDQLFERIGMHADTGIVETQAALNVERAVARELSGNRGSGARAFLQSGPLVVPMTGAEPTITVVVNNFAEIPPGILDRAQVEAGRTYRRMGVRTIWLGSSQSDGGTARGAMAPATDSGFAMTLNVQPRLAGSSGHGSRSVMAAAPRSQGDREGSIYVFYDRVTEVAAMHRADTALLMGMVIAHEMGHHLLHHADHSAEGLMRGVWDADAIRQGALGLLWFSTSEAREIRKTLSIHTLVEAHAGAGPVESQPAVRLSIDQDGGLSAFQLQLAIDEVRAIWGDAGVTVASGRYGELSRPDEARISLRILVSPAPHKKGGERVLAWVPAIETRRSAPLLFVSLPAVTEAVMGSEALGLPVARLTGDARDRLIARVIGRVTAHELGHYLLQNAGHQDRGLMRANYSSRDLVGSWLEPFRVPAAERPIVRQEIAALARRQAPFGG